MRGFKVTAQMAELMNAGKLSKIIVSEYHDVKGETFYALDEKYAFGRMTISSIERKGEISVYSFMFRSFKRKVPYKFERGMIIDNVQFDEAYSDSVDFIKDIKTYNPKNLRDDVLLDDWRIILAWYSSMKKGKKFPFSIEVVENIALMILKEMMKRGLNVNSAYYKPEAKELYMKTVERIRKKSYFIEDDLIDTADHSLGIVRPSGNIMGEFIDINTFLDNINEFKLMSPWVSVVGGIVENGATAGDIDILIRDSEPNLPLEFRIARQFPPEIAKRLHFLYDTQFYGPFTSYIPLFDKMAVSHPISSLIEMEEENKGTEFDIGDFMVKPFGHPAGQGFTARTIVSLIPEHRKFVEPFAGSATVFFTKKPSEVEVLNDINTNYTGVLRAIKSLTNAEIKSLKSSFNWKSDRKTWWRCKELIFDSKNYSSKLQRIWAFSYWSKFAYNGGVGRGAWNKFKEGKTIDIPFDKIRDRLKNTQITSVDYAECIKSNDGKTTFFYIDPPYYTADDPRFKSANIGGIDMKKLSNICSNIEGKAIISLGRDKPVLEMFLKKGWHMKKISTKYGYGWQEQMDVKWPIMLNFDASKEKIGLYQFEEFEIVDFDMSDLEDDGENNQCQKDSSSSSSSSN